MLALEVEALVDMLERAARRHEQIPQALGLGERLQFLDQLERLPASRAARYLCMIVRDSAADAGVDELAHPIAEKRLAFRKVKIHVTASACHCAPTLAKPG